jgi:hypothetical protein
LRHHQKGSRRRATPTDSHNIRDVEDTLQSRNVAPDRREPETEDNDGPDEGLLQRPRLSRPAIPNGMGHSGPRKAGKSMRYGSERKK